MGQTPTISALDDGVLVNKAPFALRILTQNLRAELRARTAQLIGRISVPIGFALAETSRPRKLYGASTGAHQFQRSSVVERSAVNRLVVGSNPTAGAKL